MKKIFSTLFVLFAGMTAFAQEPTLSVKDVEIEAGSQATFTIDITNATSLIAAASYIQLPEGMTFAEDEYGLMLFEGDVIGKTRTGFTHSVSPKLHAPNRVKYAILDTAGNRQFKNDEGSLLEVTVEAASDMATGEYTGSLETIELSAYDREVGLIKIPDVTFNIKVTNPVGIESLSADKAQISEVYSVSGAQQNGLQKGINIVKFANGEVKKVIVK